MLQCSWLLLLWLLTLLLLLLLLLLPLLSLISLHACCRGSQHGVTLLARGGVVEHAGCLRLHDEGEGDD